MRNRIVKPSRSALRSRKGVELIGETLHVPVHLPGNRTVDVQFISTKKDHAGGGENSDSDRNIFITRGFTQMII